ncbi:hypothetical protein D6D19_04954, partial [Aureobasidium pullulans]
PISTETCEKSGFDGTYERYIFVCIANVRSGQSFAKPLVLCKRPSLVWKKKPIVSYFECLLVVRVDGRMRLRSKAASSPQITPRGHVVLASLHGAHPHFYQLRDKSILHVTKTSGRDNFCRLVEHWASTMRNADSPSPIKGRENFSRVFHSSRWMFDTMSIDGG